MQFFDQFLTSYGWEGVALGGAMLLMLGTQIYYYIFRYGRVVKYKNNCRESIRKPECGISIIIPMFTEDCVFVEERLPKFLAQDYPRFEIVLVYVGQDNDFFDDLTRLKKDFPQIKTTKLHFDPRYPISRKMALNLGAKSASNDCMLFSSVDAAPQSNRWLALMAKGFEKGDVVISYCGMEYRKGLFGYLLRMWRMMHSVNWITRAVLQKPCRGTLHNMGFTQKLYFGVKGFHHLNMNIGEDDLFLQEIMTPENVSVVLSPKATMREKIWGKWSWAFSQARYFGAAREFYSHAVRNFEVWECGSRVLFFLTVVCALAVMPLEYKIVAGVLFLVRYLIVVLEVRRIARRLGEEKVLAGYFLYDLLSPVGEAWLKFLLLRKDDRVWR